MLKAMTLATYIQGVPGGMCQTSGECSYVELYRYNPKHLYPKFNDSGDIGQRKMWTSLVSAYYTLSVTWSAWPSPRQSCSSLQLTATTLASEQVFIVYSGWKSVDNYDTCASVFVVLFNGFMSLTSYFDVMYRY